MWNTHKSDVEYTYYAAGKLYTRTWDRQVGGQKAEGGQGEKGSGCQP